MDRISELATILERIKQLLLVADSFFPDAENDMFLLHICYYKSHTAPHPRRRRSS
jgi:hypothetical protein